MVKYKHKLKYKDTDAEIHLLAEDPELGYYIPNLLRDPEFRVKL